MKTNALFLLKVGVISTGLSVLVKYGGRYTSIPATQSVALAIVFVPVVLLGLGLALHYRFQSKSNANHR
ncbi:MAG: hypothetical protein AAF327_23005 [Cyanobacteria bacterium P01_A01_bin.37]